MKNLKQIVETLINQYDNGKVIDYQSVRSLQLMFGECKLVDELISRYDNGKVIDFFQLQDLDLVSKGKSPIRYELKLS